MDCIGSIFHPSIGTLSESDYHRTHTFSCYISLSIFMPFLQIEHSYSMISTCNRRGSAKSILLDTIGCIRKRSLIIKAQSLRTCGEWYTPVDGFRTILGTCYRFTNITQKERTGSQDLDIDESQYFYFLNMGAIRGTLIFLIYNKVWCRAAMRPNRATRCKNTLTVNITTSSASSLWETVGLMWM